MKMIGHDILLERTFGGKLLKTRLRFFEGGMLRVTHTLKEAFSEKQSDFTLPQKPVSPDRNGDNCFSAGELKVRINGENSGLEIRNDRDQLLLKLPKAVMEETPVVLHDYSGNVDVRMESNVDGVRARTEEGAARTDRMGLRGRQYFAFAEDEGIYGLGSHEEGYGNLRGKSRNLYQHNMKACVPALVSTKGWELVFDMGGFMSFHDDPEGSYLWCECADEFDFWFLYGETFDRTMGLYARLTGTTPMLPAAALGYVQSKERYKDAEELISTVQEYRRREIPLDMIVLDWQSWPDGQWGYKVFDGTRFPDPKGMIDRLHDMDARFMISIWPSMSGEQNENRKEMIRKGYMLGNQTIYNAFLPEARKCYWKQANELFRHGVDAWWCDCSEPFEADWHGCIRMEEHERAAVNTGEARKYLDPTQLSAYSFYHSKGIYEGQRETREDKRVMNLTRSSWIGQHRFATITWSGDIAATWETLRRQVPEGLNFCATGESQWTVDAGAFFVAHGDSWFWSGDYLKGCEDLGYRELYTRWMQYSACLPIMRSHGTDTPREVWHYGEKGTQFYDAIENAIRFRYSLFPYLYSMNGKTWTDGVPMLRVPALQYPDDPTLRQISDEMMLGDSLLVRPVTEPMYYGPDSVPLENKTTVVSVYLPAGYDWYAFDTGDKYTGGQTISFDAPLNRIPVFVRGGSILPTVPVCQHTAAAAEAPLKLTVYPGKDAEFVLYEDSGDGYSYENGQYARTIFSWNDGKQELSVRTEASSWNPPERTITAEVFGRGKRISLSHEDRKYTL